MGMNKATFVVGLQYGDEGKGKIVDLLAEKHDVVMRGNGGANAGHTIVLENGQALALHQIPSGIAYESTLNIIGNGCLFDPVKLIDEIRDAEGKGVRISPKNLAISDTAHVVLPVHKAKDAAREGSYSAQGSTKAGIAYVAADKYLRAGIRAESLKSKTEKELYKIAYDGLIEFGENPDAADIEASQFALASVGLSEYIKDSVALVHESVKSGKKILVEGAQAFGLDIDHGKYPFVTSTSTTVAGLLVGTGLNASHVGRVVGVAKATPSKVGGGTFVTSIKDTKVAEQTRGKKGAVDAEYGATTGREREVGYLDLVALKRAVDVNGVTEIALTKFDCIKRHGKTTKIAVAYSLDGEEIKSPPSSDDQLSKCEPVYQELPTWTDNESAEAQKYLEFVEDYLGVPVSMIGTGPGRNDLILRSAK
ncbi:adenylosuccinate synthetase [Candidatus Saccharibacteria bacterium]|nr:adenylosuccinate synthetase [Candidatus Saccharibacteria bacterium]